MILDCVFAHEQSIRWTWAVRVPAEIHYDCVVPTFTEHIWLTNQGALSDKPSADAYWDPAINAIPIGGWRHC